MESSFSLSLQAFSQDPGLFLPLGLSPGPCGLLCSFLKPFSVTASSICCHHKPLFWHSRIPLLATARDFFSVTAGLLSASVRLFSLSPQAPFPVTASSFPVTVSSFPCHCERSEAVSYFHRVGKETASETTRRPRRDTKRVTCEEIFALSLRGAKRALSLSPQAPFPVTASEAKQSRIPTVFPQGERGRDCFANVKTSSQ